MNGELGIYKRILVILVMISLLNNCISYDSKETIELRKNFFAKTVDFSQGQMEIQFDEDIRKGTKCVATSFIKQNTEILTASSEYIISSYHIFPMKIELFEIINELVNEELFSTEMKKDERFSHYLLVFNLMYIIYPNKIDITNYLHENNLNEYLNTYLKVNIDIANSFPKIVFGIATLEKGHFSLLKDKYLKEYNYQEFSIFHSKLLKKIGGLKHKDAILPWISDYESFLYAYTLALNRAIGIPINDFSKILDQNMINGRNEIEIKNNYLMRDNFKSISTMLSFVDSCNHEERKYSKNEKAPLILVDFNIDSYTMKSPKTYNYDDEIMFKYHTKTDNMTLFITYGFIIEENEDNRNELNFKDPVIFSIEKMMICERIGCFNTNIEEMKSLNYNDPRTIPEFKFYWIYANEISFDFLNYSMVRALPNDISYVTLNKAKQGLFDLNIKIEGFLFYIHKLRVFWKNFYFKIFHDSVINSHHFAKLIAKEEINDNHYNNLQKWKRIKNYQNIYNLDISMKRVALKNLILAEKNVISLLYTKIKQLIITNIN